MPTWTPKNKSSAPSWGTANRSSATWTGQSKTFTTQYLLQETGFHLLLETGSKIILEQSSTGGPIWTALAHS